MLNEIIEDLGSNVESNDIETITKYIEELTAIALNVSNKTILNTGLTHLIKEAVKSKYLRRGDEGTNNSSEGSLSSSYIDIEEKLRQDIIKSGLRGIK